MKAINITPEVIKLEKKLLKDKNLKVAGYMLKNALNKEQIQIFREEDGKLFWFENRDAAKYAVKFLTYHITRYMKLEYRDGWKEEKKADTKKTVKEKVVTKKESPQQEEESLSSPDVKDLQAFTKKYMNGYKIPAEFKKKDLTEKEQSKLFAEISGTLTECLQKYVQKIYGGKKPDFRNKNRMSAEERKEFTLNNHQEFDWYLNNLVFLGKPTKSYIDKFGKFSTANYLKVTADLRSLVVNSLFMLRTSKLF